MKMTRVIFILISVASYSATAQDAKDLTYFLPSGITYDSNIPEPSEIIGHEVGEWHISHDKLVNYMYALAGASDRIEINEIGKTFEGRPLLNLIITSPSNHAILPKLKSEHAQLCDPDNSMNLDISKMPAFAYLGYSIHGNEASGSNAALLVAYYLASAQGEYIEKLLSETVIILDPSYNPDGLNRFANYVNANKSFGHHTDPGNMELNEPWPRARTNHYWFDLNRDWLVAQLPESQARIQSFQSWHPNLLTDHHEMGSDGTFFFQPGVPSRNNPLTPEKNYTLTKKLGEYHASALDKIGSLYYTQENFDDFYYGKGSTYPDVNGAVGILFEQASARGHARETVNGVLNFSFSIRNHFVTSLSSLKGLNENREEFLRYQRDFYKESITQAKSSSEKAIIFGSKDKQRNYHLAEIVNRHGIEIYSAKNNSSINGKNFGADEVFIIPLEQPKSKLIHAMFDKTLKFEDSLFYDVSAWTLPLAFNVDYTMLTTKSYSSNQLGEKFNTKNNPVGTLVGGISNYAYVFDWVGYYSPKLLNHLLQKGYKVKVANEGFYAADRYFDKGAIIISVSLQRKPKELIAETLEDLARENGIDIYALNTGLDYKGVSLGSPSFDNIELPKVLMLVGNGVSSYDAGEIWHLFDQRFEMDITLMPIDVFNRTEINRYNTIVLVDGNYSDVSIASQDKLKTWVKNGGLIVASQNALKYLNKQGLAKFKFKKSTPLDSLKNRNYEDIDEFQGAQQIGGAIFETSIDRSNPLFYGFENNKLPVFRNSELFLEKASGGYSNPMLYTEKPLLSGYISKQNLDKLKGSAAVGISVYGSGRIIGFTDNLNFRAFWYGTNKIFMNAIFFGRNVDRAVAR